MASCQEKDNGWQSEAEPHQCGEWKLREHSNPVMNPRMSSIIQCRSGFTSTFIPFYFNNVRSDDPAVTFHCGALIHHHKTAEPSLPMPIHGHGPARMLSMHESESRRLLEFLSACFQQNHPTISACLFARLLHICHAPNVRLRALFCFCRT